MKILTPLLLCLSAYGSYVFAQRTFPEVMGRYELMTSVPLANVDRRVLDLMTLGHKELYDNFLHIWTTQYLGSDKIMDHDPDVVAEEVYKLLHLKVKSESFYLLSCFRFVFNFDRPQLCERIALAGMETLPENWMIPSVLGYAYLKLERFPEAAATFELAGNINGAPAYFKTVGRKILEKNEVDPQTHKKILETLESSGSTQKVIKRLQNK